MEAEAGGADACGCTACVGSRVMCRVKRGTLRSGDDKTRGLIMAATTISPLVIREH